MMHAILLLLGLIGAPDEATPASLPGVYDGGQMEMGAGLELGADGRFRYGLSYGALDEEAEGSWSFADGKVLLTSDPVTPPRFAYLGPQPGHPGTLSVSLETPDGMSRQYFDLHVEFASGHRERFQMHDEGDTIIPIPAGETPARVVLALPIFDLRSDPVPVDLAKGNGLAFRFEPHDLGRVAFDHAPLALEDGALLLPRYGRTIRFRRVEESPIPH